MILSCNIKSLWGKHVNIVRSTTAVLKLNNGHTIPVFCLTT